MLAQRPLAAPDTIVPRVRPRRCTSASGRPTPGNEPARWERGLEAEPCTCSALRMCAPGPVEPALKQPRVPVVSAWSVRGCGEWDGGNGYTHGCTAKRANGQDQEPRHGSRARRSAASASARLSFPLAWGEAPRQAGLSLRLPSGGCVRARVLLAPSWRMSAGPPPEVSARLLGVKVAGEQGSRHPRARRTSAPRVACLSHLGVRDDAAATPSDTTKALLGGQS